MKFILKLFGILWFALTTIIIFVYCTQDIEFIKDDLIVNCDPVLSDKEYAMCIDKNILIRDAETKLEIPDFITNVIKIFLALILKGMFLSVVILLLLEAFGVDDDWNPIISIKEKKERKKINNFYKQNKR